MKIAIIGGGVIGLLTAYYLKKSGHEITILDKTDLTDGCSYGNAGYICPSHFVPLTAPGMIKQGILWMFDAQSPFYIRPRLNSDFIKWAWLFYRNANAAHVNRSCGPLTEMAQLSKSCYEDMFNNESLNADYRNDGILMVAQNKTELAHMYETVEMAQKVGLKPQILDQDEVRKRHPKINLKCEGGVYYPEDGMIHPAKLMAELKRMVTGMKVKIVSECVAHDFDTIENRISKVRTNQGLFQADAFIVAAGVWSAGLVKQIGISMPLEAGKGYHISCDKNFGIDHPIILEDAKVAVTPLGLGVQFAGTMELAGINEKINSNRIIGIQKAVLKYFPDIKEEDLTTAKTWVGLRPVSPDGLAYVGRIKPYQNLYVGAGHGMLGISQGAGTANMLMQLVQGEPVPDWLSAFDPNRFDGRFPLTGPSKA